MDHNETSELLNAYLDGELADAEKAQVETALADSPELADELAALTAVRAEVRDLPMVEPPAGFFEAMLEKGTADPTAELPANVASLSAQRESRRSLRSKLTSGIAVAAVFLLVLGFGSGIAAIERVPALDEFASRHAEAAAAMPEMEDDEMQDMETDGYHLMDLNEATKMGPSGSSMQMMSAYENDDDVLQMIYTDGKEVISVFRQSGYVESNDMPESETMKMDGDDAWHLQDGEADILVVDRDGVTYTIVGSLSSGAAMEELAQNLPEPDGGLFNQVQKTCKSLLDGVGL